MTIRPYRSALDQAQDRLDQMKVQLEASQRDPLSVGGPALPTGAEPDLWTALGTRDLYKIIGSVPTSRDLLRCPTVTVVAEQRRNGSLGRIDIDVDARGSLNPTQARELASFLVDGSDLADEWAGYTPIVNEVIAAARAAVERLHKVLRACASDTAGTAEFAHYAEAVSYAQAGLDSLADAAQVITRAADLDLDGEVQR